MLPNTQALKVGDRVVVKQTAGFHRGARGVITVMGATGKAWVRRDRAGSDVWYDLDELEPETTSETTPAATYTDTQRLDWVRRAYRLGFLDRDTIDSLMRKEGA